MVYYRVGIYGTLFGAGDAILSYLSEIESLQGWEAEKEANPRAMGSLNDGTWSIKGREGV